MFAVFFGIGVSNDIRPRDRQPTAEINFDLLPSVWVGDGGKAHWRCRRQMEVRCTPGLEFQLPGPNQVLTPGRGCPGTRGFSGGGPPPETCRAVGTRVSDQERPEEGDRRGKE